MSSAVDISNQALLILGASPIVSFEDETLEANALKVLYGPAKKHLLRAYDWNCANKTATLALLDEQPIQPHWTSLHAWPDDALRILEVIEFGHPTYRRVEWEVEGRRIYTRSNNVAARYIADVPEPMLDPHVESALAGKLALDLSYTLTSDNSRESNVASLYASRLDEARTTDSQERSSRRFRIDTLLHARL